VARLVLDRWLVTDARPAAFLLWSTILTACGPTAVETPLPTESAFCTLVGCSDVVIVRFVDLLSNHAAALPLSATLVLDETTITANVALGRPGGEGCFGGAMGTACCVLDPPGEDSECVALVEGDLQVLLPVPAEGAFDGAKHGVVATVQGADGETLFTAAGSTHLRMNQPNGPECEPTCYQGGVEFAEPP
jgi:hypothetical protein